MACMVSGFSSLASPVMAIGWATATPNASNPPRVTSSGSLSPMLGSPPLRTTTAQ